jgi:hypothetical protein
MNKLHSIVILFLMMSSILFSQQSIGTSGKDISTAGGAISYSVGQLVASSVTGTGSIHHGIQQHIKLIVLDNPLITSISLKIRSYPNPTTDYVMLEFTDLLLKDISYSIFKINGQEIVHCNVATDKTKINVESLAQGIYILKVHKENKELSSFKIIKK